VYTFQSVGKQGGFRARDPHPSPYFEPYTWIPYLELVEKRLRFYKDGRFEEVTNVRKEYNEPGSTLGDPPKQTPWESKENATGTYEVRGNSGMLLYATGARHRFSFDALDAAFWPPATIVIKDTKWTLAE
jgi:hypothetical protein